MSWCSFRYIVVAQLLSRVQFFAILRTVARKASLSFTISWNWLKLMSTESVMPFSHLILYCPLLLLPSIFPSIRVFSNGSTLPWFRWPKNWSFCISISLSNEFSGLISFKTDWFDILAVQGTFKGLFQQHSLKVSILQHSLFFMVQLSHLYMTTGKTIALTMWTFVNKVISLLFNTLPRLTITLLQRSKCLLISWLQSPSAVIFGAQEYKVCHCFHCLPINLPWNDGPRCHDLRFLNVEF